MECLQNSTDVTDDKTPALHFQITATANTPSHVCHQPHQASPLPTPQIIKRNGMSTVTTSPLVCPGGPATGSSAVEVVAPHLVGGAAARPEGAPAGTAVCPGPSAKIKQSM